MGNAYLNNAGVFLIQVVFGFFILLVMLRFMLALVRADFYNPVSQFIVKVTNPLLVPLRRIIPGVGGIDLSSLILVFVLQALEIFLSALVVGIGVGVVNLAIISIAELLDLILSIYLFSILILVILSWVAPHTHNPVTGLLYSLTEPLMRPARRLLPPISGFDLSPILVMVALQLMKMLLVAPIRDLGAAIRF